MRTNKKNLLIWIAVVLVVVLGLVWYFGTKPRSVISPTTSQAPVGQTYTNAKGQKWGPLTQGNYAFQVASAETIGPKFLQGEINPLDVHVGDVQKFKIIVQSPVGIKLVVAKIETDNGTENILLQKTGIVSADQLAPSRYKVANNGQLNILTEKEIAAAIQKERVLKKSGVINSALAAGNEKEVWEGQWTVRDTHVKTYHTVFVAEDNSNNSDILTMAWSDPCNYTPSGANAALTQNCSLGSGLTEGWDGGTLTINSSINLALGSNSIFAFNPGPSGGIILSSGASITNIINSAALKKGYVYYTDNDCDGFPLNSTLYYASSVIACSPGGTGVTRRSLATSTIDCYDTNANAHPGQTNYFTTDRGDGSFDYDCDGNGDSGAQNPAPGIGKCSTYPATCPADPILADKGVVGYTASTNCGASGTYVSDPGGCFPPYEGAAAVSCVSGSQTYTCTLATQQYGSGGKCATYTAPCPVDPVPANEGKVGFTTSTNCGASNTYVSDPGGCFPTPGGGGTPRSCVTGSQTQACR